MEFSEGGEYLCPLTVHPPKGQFATVSFVCVMFSVWFSLLKTYFFIARSSRICPYYVDISKRTAIYEFLANCFPNDHDTPQQCTILCVFI